jgi:hypothetical protein
LITSLASTGFNTLLWWVTKAILVQFTTLRCA